MAYTTDLKSVDESLEGSSPSYAINLTTTKNMSDLIENKYITEKQAKLDGFKILAGPFLEGEMTMAYKIMDEVKRNSRHAALVQRIKKRKKRGCVEIHYEVWQKSANTYSSKK